MRSAPVTQMPMSLKNEGLTPSCGAEKNNQFSDNGSGNKTGRFTT